MITASPLAIIHVNLERCESRAFLRNIKKSFCLPCQHTIVNCSKFESFSNLDTYFGGSISRLLLLDALLCKMLTTSNPASLSHPNCCYSPKQVATGAALVRDLAESHLQEEAGRNLMAELRAELSSAEVNPDLYP